MCILTCAKPFNFYVYTPTHTLLHVREYPANVIHTHTEGGKTQEGSSAWIWSRTEEGIHVHISIRIHVTYTYAYAYCHMHAHPHTHMHCTHTHTHTHTRIRLNNWANKRVTTAALLDLPALTHCLPSPKAFFGTQVIGLSVWICDPSPLTLSSTLSYPPARTHTQTQTIYGIYWHRWWRGRRVMRWVSGWRSGARGSAYSLYIPKIMYVHTCMRVHS